jgi:hypothetical protein
MGYDAPTFAPPYRVLLLMSSTNGWYDANEEERDAALDQLRAVYSDAQDAGARLLASMDDDLFVTGHHSPSRYSIYVLYDVDDLGVIVELVHRLRTSPLNRYLRLEARVGRQLFLLDR